MSRFLTQFVRGFPHLVRIFRVRDPQAAAVLLA
jgi:hypothetical protein